MRDDELQVLARRLREMPDGEIEARLDRASQRLGVVSMPRRQRAAGLSSALESLRLRLLAEGFWAPCCALAPRAVVHVEFREAETRMTEAGVLEFFWEDAPGELPSNPTAYMRARLCLGCLVELARRANVDPGGGPGTSSTFEGFETPMGWIVGMTFEVSDAVQAEIRGPEMNRG